MNINNAYKILPYYIHFFKFHEFAYFVKQLAYSNISLINSASKVIKWIKYLGQTTFKCGIKLKKINIFLKIGEKSYNYLFIPQTYSLFMPRRGKSGV